MGFERIQISGRQLLSVKLISLFSVQQNYSGVQTNEKQSNKLPIPQRGDHNDGTHQTPQDNK